MGDVLDFLPQAEGFDVIYSVFGAVWFVEPAKLLPLVRSSLLRGGVFAFSHLPPNGLEGPTAGKAVTKWHYSPTRWVELLVRHGFQAEADVIPAPVAGPGTMLVRARS
ncbi:hypothetical protein LX83_006584 [Goodfellowiella coeruleoviolacea]|uniref:Uncharacterized protein n=1 Tax=Goodfellowiella coeruleoviolacea TaxID=334858 RepID=A0AAE3GL94_9PSEU|nr:hypothetical protein [Goodfellowiella coeruleoviolacea]